jgi:DNA-binding response OmpR family regulator
VALSLAALLRRQGHRVDVAHSGAAALAAAAACRPQVALIDLGLPDMDGCALADRFREQPDLCKVRLVALTGWSDDESRRLGQAAGFTCHLVKPVDFEGLHAVLRSVAGSFQPIG